MTLSSCYIASDIPGKRDRLQRRDAVIIYVEAAENDNTNVDAKVSGGLITILPSFHLYLT